MNDRDKYLKKEKKKRNCSILVVAPCLTPTNMYAFVTFSVATLYNNPVRNYIAYVGPILSQVLKNIRISRYPGVRTHFSPM